MIKEDHPSIPYIKNLDGLRGIAIILVVIDHWAPWKELHNILEFGRSGLLLFFMLSGYLITSVLLSLREKIESQQLNTSQALKNFYMRRVLRVLPIYLLAVLIAAILFKNVRHDFIYHILFLQNISATFATAQPVYDGAMHLWSLAVEEQFYLLWAPVLLFLANHRLMVKICLIAILVALLFRGICIVGDFSVWTLRLNTLGNIDSLAIGCLVALDKKYKFVDWQNGIAHNLERTARFIALPLVISLIILNQIYGYQNLRTMNGYKLFHDAIMQIPFWLLLRHALDNRNKLLSNRYLIWIGKKSYGIYVWHQFVRFIAIALVLHLFDYQLKLTDSILSFAIFVSLTLMVAAISWRFIERPFLKYKSKWD